MTAAVSARAELERRQHEIAHAITRRLFQERPEMEARYGAIGRSKCVQDTTYHLRYLGESIEAGSPALFLEYIGWAKVLLAGYRIPGSDLELNLDLMRRVIPEHLPGELGQKASEYLQKAIEALPASPDQLPSEISETKPHGVLAREYLNRLLEGNRRGAAALVMDAVNRGTSIRDIYLNVFEPAQREIGRLWQCNNLSVAQEHFCTAATQMIMSQLFPMILSSERNGLNMVATSVSGELHEIGIRMISDFLEMDGWDTFYVGANAPIASIVKTLKEQKAHLLAISATMSFHLGQAADLIRAVRGDPGCALVKIMVGGFPFNVDPELWRKIGADGTAPAARDVGMIAKKLVLG